jgi:hypothetical protein
MALARFKDLSLDAVDPALAGGFWAAALGRTWHVQDNGDGHLTGPTEQHTIWVNAVPEAKAAKNRVHLDVYAGSLTALEALGATVVVPKGSRAWTVMADPEGGEFCAFVRRGAIPLERLHGLVVDCADPQAQARWWGSVYGVPVTVNYSWYTLKGVPGMPIATMDFCRVPEPKVVKNRMHWDVWVAEVEPLVSAGATVLRKPGGDIAWHVLADPEGNEFCAFTGEPAAGPGG